MELNYVVLQGRFSSDGKFVGGSYVPEVIEKLMSEAYKTVGQSERLYRMRIAVQLEDLGAEVEFCNPVPEKQGEPQAPTAPHCVTAGNLIPAQGIDTAPEVVA